MKFNCYIIKSLNKIKKVLKNFLNLYLKKKLSLLSPKILPKNIFGQLAVLLCLGIHERFG